MLMLCGITDFSRIHRFGFTLDERDGGNGVENYRSDRGGKAQSALNIYTDLHILT